MTVRRKSVHSDAVYWERMRRMKLVHNFTFDKRHKLTSQRKTAITKQWEQFKDIIKDLEDGVYTFIDATKAERDVFKDQYEVTNKGIVYNKKADAGTTRKTSIIGKGKNRQLLDDITLHHPMDEKRPRKFTLYLPFTSLMDQANIDEFVMRAWKELKPKYISVAVNGYAGTRMISARDFRKYVPELNNQIEQPDWVEQHYTGIYIIYLRAAYSTKWLENLKQKVQEFQSN